MKVSCKGPVAHGPQRATKAEAEADLDRARQCKSREAMRSFLASLPRLAMTSAASVVTRSGAARQCQLQETGDARSISGEKRGASVVTGVQGTDHENSIDKRRRIRQTAEAGAADQIQAATGLEAIGHDESLTKSEKF